MVSTDGFHLAGCLLESTASSVSAFIARIITQLLHGGKPAAALPCSGFDMNCAPSTLKRLLAQFRSQSGPAARIDLDQCPATTATVLDRARLLGRRDTDLLLLGDDDLLTIVLAKTRARKRIVVLDADDALLARMRRFASC